ncbi:MAG TPA: PAS domain S-box protein [Gemmatimonadales bacterium]|jgi:PAS domain S-box-containing protein|nr:PAS domain S-box protein [Gemmatimonadales bacterium]
MTLPPSDSNLPAPEPRPGDSGVTRVAFVRQIAGQVADRAGPGPAVHPAEKALDESRRLLELFFADSLDGFFFMMLDRPVRWDESVDKEAALDYVFAHDRITRVNPAMAAQYGASPEALLGRTPAEFYAHDPGPARTRWRGFFDTGRLHVETHQRKLDGTPIWIEGDYMCLYAPDGRIIGHFGIQRDITARHRAEEALRFSEEKFAKAFRACPLRVSIGTLAEGRFIEVNDAFLRDHGFTREQVIGRTSPELGLWADPDDRRRLVNELERGGMVREWEFRGQTRDGQVQITSLSAELIQVGGEACILAVATDVTDRKRAEQAIRSSREELRALAARLQSVREDERAHIAREVHDELGQALTGLKLDLAWLKPRLRDQVPLLERVQAVIGRIDGTIDAVRRIATELRPSVLDHLGLVAAVEWQAREFEKLTGIVVRLSLSSAHFAVHGTVATTVFRMLQEALTNVARHAGATWVEIALEIREGALTLRVADNGKGISLAERTDPHSLGLVGLRERAIACAGDLVIEGRPGEGTILTARIPLPLAAVIP